MADLSRAEIRAVHAAANWVNCDGFGEECAWFPDHMRTHAGRNWRPNLRRGLAALSRELAKDTKRRK